MKYHILKVKSGRRDAFLSALPPGGPAAFEYQSGIALADRHLKKGEAKMYFDPNREGGVILNDFVDNLDNVIIANGKVRKTLQSFGDLKVEFLPVDIYDHQDALASEDYAIINPVGSIDAIDMERSEFVMSALDKGQINFVEELALNYDKIPEDAILFRALTKLDLIFIREDVSDALISSGATGLNLIDAEGWDGFD